MVIFSYFIQEYIWLWHASSLFLELFPNLKFLRYERWRQHASNLYNCNRKGIWVKLIHIYNSHTMLSLPSRMLSANMTVTKTSSLHMSKARSRKEWCSNKSNDKNIFFREYKEFKHETLCLNHSFYNEVYSKLT